MSSQFRLTPERAVLAGLLLAAVLYLQDLRYDFLLDDVQLVLMSNRTASWANAKEAFTTHISSVPTGEVTLETLAVHYRPVYTLWQMLNRWLFGGVLPWWHLTSLILNIGVIYLVYLLGVQVLKEKWPAALGALLFAFHPIHAESVSYVTASTDLLVTLFSLIAFLLYVRFREQQASSFYLIASVVAAAIAMLSKENGAVFPLLLVAYEALRGVQAGEGPKWKRFVWTLPFFAVVAAYTVTRTLLFGFNAGPGPGFSRLTALLDAPLVLLVYLRKLVWPFRLSFFYPIEWSSQWTVARACGVVIAATVAVFLWKYLRVRPGARLMQLWTAILFVIPVISVSTFTREHWVHDRHMYLVSVPFCLAAAALLTYPGIPTKVCVATSSIILAILLVETAVQVPRFKDEVTIYASALKVNPNSAMVHDHYARALANSGNAEGALSEFKIATELAPKWAFAHDTYGSLLVQAGRDDAAAAEFDAALRWSIKPNAFRAHILYELATLELAHSQPAQAAEHLREALQIEPQGLSYHALLSVALQREGREQEAEQEMRSEAKVRQQFVHNSSAPQ